MCKKIKVHQASQERNQLSPRKLLKKWWVKCALWLMPLSLWKNNGHWVHQSGQWLHRSGFGNHCSGLVRFAAKIGKCVLVRNWRRQEKIVSMYLCTVEARSWNFGDGHDWTEFGFGWLYLQTSQHRFIRCWLPLSILQRVGSKTWRPWSKRSSYFARFAMDYQRATQSLHFGERGRPSSCKTKQSLRTNSYKALLLQLEAPLEGLL